MGGGGGQAGPGVRAGAGGGGGGWQPAATDKWGPEAENIELSSGLNFVSNLHLSRRGIA